jgi:hypothetical protein
MSAWPSLVGPCESIGSGTTVLAGKFWMSFIHNLCRRLIYLCNFHWQVYPVIRTHGHHRLDNHSQTERFGTQEQSSGEASGFVYIYNLLGDYTENVLNLDPIWHSDQYDYDVHIHRHLLNSPVRTHDPDKARLFYLPLYLSKRLNWFWNKRDPQVRFFRKPPRCV